MTHICRFVANIVSPWTAWVAFSPRTEGEFVCVCVCVLALDEERKSRVLSPRSSGELYVNGYLWNQEDSGLKQRLIVYVLSVTE